MNRKRPTRRDLLRASAGVAGVVSAGCFGAPSDDSAPGDPEGPATDPELLPSPSAFGSGSTAEGYPFGKFDVEALLEHREQFSEASIANFASSQESRDVVDDVRDLQAFVNVGADLGSGFGIASGSFDVDRVANSLADAPIDSERIESYGGAEIYGGSATLYGSKFATATAIESDAVTSFTVGPTSPDEGFPPRAALVDSESDRVSAAVAGVKTLLAARRGDAEQYVEASGAVGALVDALSADPHLAVNPSPDLEHFLFPPADEAWTGPTVAYGNDTRIEGSTAVDRRAFVGADGDPPPVEALRNAVREYDRPVPGFESTSVDARGRVALVEGRMPTSGTRLHDGRIQFVQPPPEVTFEFDWNPSETQLRVTHAGGERITPENAGGVRVEAQRWFNGFADDPDPVVPGDSISVPASPGETVEVVWESHGLRLRRTIAEYTVPG